MTDTTGIEGLSTFWRVIWTFGKSAMVMVWLCIPFAFHWVMLKTGEDGLEFVNSLGYYIPNFLLFAMALGFDAISIARALGWSRGEAKAKPVVIVNPSDIPDS